MSPRTPHRCLTAIAPVDDASYHVLVDGRKTARTVVLLTPAYCAATGVSPLTPNRTFVAIAPVGLAVYQVPVDGRNTPMRAKPSPAVVIAGRSPDTPKWNV